MFDKIEDARNEFKTIVNEKLENVSRTTITKNLKFSKDKKYIKRNGSDKNGYWQILK